MENIGLGFAEETTMFYDDEHEIYSFGAKVL